MSTVSRFQELFAQLSQSQNRTIAVANAQGKEVLSALKQAQELIGISAFLLGKEEEIRQMMAEISMREDNVTVLDYPDAEECALAAVKLVRNGTADILMKGMIDSGIFLKAVIHPDFGLRTESGIIATVAVMETERGFLFITDPGFTPLPSLHQKELLVEQTVQVAKKLGIERPKVAIISGAEKVNRKMSSSVEADKLKQMYRQKDIGCVVDGPLSLDIAVSQEAAFHKNYCGEIRGDADILIMPSLEAGNVLYKSMVHFAHIPTGGIVTGAAAPIVFTSRSDDAATKLNTIAFACALAKEICL